MRILLTFSTFCLCLGSPLEFDVDKFLRVGKVEHSSSSSVSGSNNVPHEGRRDIRDVCARRCSCSGERYENVTCEHLADFGTLQEEFDCPNKIEVLVLRNVTFRNPGTIRLDSNNFTDFRMLSTLRIIDSRINIIGYTAFLHARNHLKNIEITNSNIKRIEGGAFAYLDLDKLDLSNNRIFYYQKISPGTFQDARAIRTLILRNTSLSSLPTSTLAPIAPTLLTLDISYNKLHTLSTDLIPIFCQVFTITIFIYHGTLLILFQLNKLAMNNNTWCCAKPGRWLSLFLKLTYDQLPHKIVGDFPPTCEGGPRPLKGRIVSDVSYDEMDQYETCEGLLGPKDPRTCHELMAKFNELFAAEMANNQRHKNWSYVEPKVKATTPAVNNMDHFEHDYDHEEHIVIAGGSKMKAVVDFQEQWQGDDYVEEPKISKEALLNSAQNNTLSCGFVDCFYLAIATIGGVVLVAIVTTGIATYTMLLKKWRNQSRRHLVERISS